MGRHPLKSPIHGGFRGLSPFSCLPSPWRSWRLLGVLAVQSSLFVRGGDERAGGEVDGAADCAGEAGGAARGHAAAGDAADGGAVGRGPGLWGAREVDFRQLTPDPDQPRKSMNPDRLAELAESIVSHGLLQPIVVRQTGLDLGGDMRYVVVAGGRRYAAIQLALEGTGDEAVRARLLRVPVVINDSEAAERRVLQLIENLQREDLNAVEEARALKEIARIEGLTTTGLAGRVHRSQGYVDERLRLLRHEDVEDAVETGLLTKSAGAAIASIRSADERRDWLERARRGRRSGRARCMRRSRPG
ncbi:MAG: ParB/RepB/Spo0J family partition protein [Chloroflexia bacterium]